MTARTVLFQIHWFLGITAGFVLALMGVTGALMAFEDEIMAALSPGIVTVAPAATPRLSPDALVAAASWQRNGARVTDITIAGDPALAGEVHFAAAKGERRGERSYIDPHSGVLLGKARGAGFFRTVQDLHRWLALPGAGNGIGRQITGVSAIALIFFALSGLYLRWPRHPLDWRAWLVLDLRKTGRNLYRTLHAVIGGWVLLFYLLSALTGLWWSYDWYRQAARYALTGISAPAAERHDTPGPAPTLAPAWAALLRSEGDRFARVNLAFSAPDQPVIARVLPQGARFDRMTDELRFDPRTGAPIKADRYADRPVGATIATNVLPLHTGAFFGWPGRIALFVTSLTMPLFTVTGLLLYLARRRSKRALAAIAPGATASESDADAILIVHASQTGNAERLARLSAAAFPHAVILPIAQLTPDRLRRTPRALFVIATYGEGDAPDPARAFETKIMAHAADLTGLDYALLALGDREYPDYCAFGHRVDAWLHASGARRLFDSVLLDGADADGERHWQQQLHAIGGDIAQPDWQPAAFAPATLIERTWINPGSSGAPVYRILLDPPPGTAWEPGAIAEILPRHDPARIAATLSAAGLPEDHSAAEQLATTILPDPGPFDPATLRPLPHRDYSVASIAASGRIELLVRLCTAPDGGLGIGSGWLTRTAAIDAPVQIRLRANPGFAAPADPATPLVLIGNGTGLAGLMAHLRDRARTGGGPVWLLYGERNGDHDRPFADELERLQADGILTRIDRAFSRDPGDGRYVQHLLAERATEIADWADRRAAFYVCGSLAGMAPAVDAVLRTVLGDDRVEAMIAHNLYRRDIY